LVAPPWTRTGARRAARRPSVDGAKLIAGAVAPAGSPLPGRLACAGEAGVSNRADSTSAELGLAAGAHALQRVERIAAAFVTNVVQAIGQRDSTDPVRAFLLT
jgi:hypothetical protein